jgi:hypothetical protein
MTEHEHEHDTSGPTNDNGHLLPPVQMTDFAVTAANTWEETDDTDNTRNEASRAQEDGNRGLRAATIGQLPQSLPPLSVVERIFDQCSRLGVDDGTVSFDEITLVRRDEMQTCDLVVGCRTLGVAFTTDRSEMIRAANAIVEGVPRINPLGNWITNKVPRDVGLVRVVDGKNVKGQTALLWANMPSATGVFFELVDGRTLYPSVKELVSFVSESDRAAGEKQAQQVQMAATLCVEWKNAHGQIPERQTRSPEVSIAAISMHLKSCGRKKEAFFKTKQEYLDMIPSEKLSRLESSLQSEPFESDAVFHIPSYRIGSFPHLKSLCDCGSAFREWKTRCTRLLKRLFSSSFRGRVADFTEIVPQMKPTILVFGSHCPELPIPDIALTSDQITQFRGIVVVMLLRAARSILEDPFDSMAKDLCTGIYQDIYSDDSSDSGLVQSLCHGQMRRRILFERDVYNGYRFTKGGVGYYDPLFDKTLCF